MLVTQAQFAAMKSVSRAAVSQWKREGRIVIVGKLIDVAATERRLTTESSHRSKRVRPAAVLNLIVPVREPLGDSPASVAALVTGGAADLAVILLRQGMPRDRAEAIVEEWLTRARVSATALLEDDLDPPAPFERWADHPAFTADWLEGTTWAELEAEAAQLQAGG
jgi:hypothetical protein